MASPSRSPEQIAQPELETTDRTGVLSADTTDTNSDYESLSEYESETTTLATAITEGRYENGRRYHSYREGQYWGPNDEQQNDQLDLFHHVYNMVLGGELYRAPIGKHPQNILDLGTGTGIWAIDMADKFPSAVVLGNDLSAIQPSWVPPNCKFEVDDITLPWTHTKNHYDFIHARALYGAIADWPTLFHEVYEHLKPNGWFESVETGMGYLSDDNSIPADDCVTRWTRNLEKASEMIGKPFGIAHKTAGWMQDAGFVDVHKEVYKVPIGPWPKDKKHKEVGTYNLLNLLQALEGFTMAMYTRVLKVDPEDVQKELVDLRKALKDKSRHAYYEMHVSYGRKPDTSET